MKTSTIFLAVLAICSVALVLATTTPTPCNFPEQFQARSFSVRYLHHLGITKSNQFIDLIPLIFLLGRIG